jgi:hypothetical protein
VTNSSVQARLDLTAIDNGVARFGSVGPSGVLRRHGSSWLPGVARKGR